MNIEDGKRAGVKKAHADFALFEKASQQYGRLIKPMMGEVSRSLALAHVLRVNPELLMTPPVTLDRRRGFMLATREGATAAGIEWKSLDDPSTCAYSWGREMNQGATDFYKKNTDIFTTPDDDFWKIIYLRHVLSVPLFDVLWGMATDTTYSGIVYAVNTLRHSPMGLPIATLKRLVLVDMEYVFELALRKGGMKSSKFGIQPVMDKDRVQRILMSDKLGEI